MQMMSKEDLINAVKSNVKLIEEQALAENKLALEIVRWYEMWRVCSGDNMAYVVLEDNYKQWVEQEKKTISGNYDI
jgi:predicted  nucleic acid-binding Zn ribbon protein